MLISDLFDLAHPADAIVWMLVAIGFIAVAGLFVAAVKAVRYGRFWAGWEAGRRSLHQDQTDTKPAGFIEQVKRP